MEVIGIVIAFVIASVVIIFYLGVMSDFLNRYDKILDLGSAVTILLALFWPITWPTLYLSQLYRRRNSKCKITKISNICYAVWRKNDLGKWEFVHDLPSLKEAIAFAKTNDPASQAIWYL